MREVSIKCPCCKRPIASNEFAFNGVVANRKIQLRGQMVEFTERIERLTAAAKKDRTKEAAVEVLRQQLESISSELSELEAIK